MSIIPLPQAALAQIWEAEKAARIGIDRSKRQVHAVDNAIQSAQLGVARCFTELQKQNDAFAETALGSARDFVKAKKRYDCLLKKKERLEAKKEQYGYQATLRILGKRSWNKLTDKSKWKKGNLLTMVYASISIGMEKLCIDGLVPAALQDDRNILMARLFHQLFHGPYYTRATDCPVFVIPEALTTDKEVVETAVFRYPEILKQDVISEQLLDDDAVFSAFIQSPRWTENKGLYQYRDIVAAGCDDETLPGLLTKFSARIRGSSRLMLEAARTTSSVLYCLEGELRGDPTFTRQLIERVQPGQHSWNGRDATKLQNDALEHLPDSVRTDPGVVLACVSKNGLCLHGATIELRRLEEIVRAACYQCADAFFYCAPGPTKSKLLADKDFMLHVLSKVSPNSLSSFSGEDKDLYKMLPSDLQLDREIFHSAIESGNILSLPPSLAADRTFLRAKIEKYSFLWHKLPSHCKDDVTFARAIKNFEDFETVSAVFRQFPMLLQDRDIWWTIIDSDGDESDFPGALEDAVIEFAPASIRQDRELMLRAVTRNAYVFEHLPPHLKEEREFVESLAELADALTLMPEHVQLLHRDLVVASLRSQDGNEVEELIDYVAPALLADPAFRTDIQTKYVEDGNGPVDCPDDWKIDETFGLLVAEHLGKERYFEDLVSSTLRSKKSFMTKAVRLNPLHFLQAVGALRRDHDLALIAISSEEKGSQIVCKLTGNFYDAEVDDDEDDETVDPTPLPDAAFFRGFWHEAKEKIRTHEAFFAGILCGLFSICRRRLCSQHPAGQR